MDRVLAPTYIEQSTELKRDLYIGVHLTAWASGASALVTEWRNETSEAVRNAFPFLADLRFSFEVQTVRPNNTLDELSIDGLWFDLPVEPEPFRDVAELLECIGTASDINAEPLDILVRSLQQWNKGSTLFIGLRFPGRAIAPDWLVVAIMLMEDAPKHGDDLSGIRREILRAGFVYVLRRHPLLRSELELRNRGTVQASLSARTVLVLGAGALGGDVAECLAKAGVGRLDVVDPDTIRPGNVIRHVAGIETTGLAKSDAVVHRVRRQNPFVKIVSHPVSATQDPNRLDEFLRNADLAVCTIADENIEHVINEAAIRCGTTVVYGRALRAGRAARVFRVRPGADACKACLAQFRNDAEGKRNGGSPEDSIIDLNDWIDLPQVPDAVIARECGNPILAGSAIDLRFAADLTARAALDELEGGTAWNNLLWSQEALPDVHSALTEPYSIVRRSVPRHPRCSVCGRPRTECVRLSEGAHASMISYAEGKADRETGGVLLGYFTQGVVHVVEATDAGPNAIETPQRYVHDAEYVNQLILEAAVRLGDHGTYVGEWHTHLEANPRPSARDVESMAAIAVAPHYLTDEPVMLIAGVNPTTSRVATFHGSCFPNGRRMSEVRVVFEDVRDN